MKLKPHIHKGRFYNHPHESIVTYIKSVLVSIKHMFKKRDPFFTHGKNQTIKQWVVQPTFQETPANTTLTWLGHATFLCHIGGYNIITDPVFGEISQFFPRMVPSPLKTTASLPNIDIVLISHNHHDHLDEKSLKKLKQHDPLFFVPQGDKKWFDKHNFSRVIEYSWWEQHTLPARNNDQPVTIQFLPAHHWSGRGFWNINRSLWGSWLMSHQEQNVYFGGDTAFSEHFSVIGEAVKKIDIALLPIGPCEPRQGQMYSHINPEQAIQAFKNLNATHFIPMHWGTFRQGADSFNYAIDKLSIEWEQSIKDPQKKLHLVRFGETTDFPFAD